MKDLIIMATQTSTFGHTHTSIPAATAASASAPSARVTAPTTAAVTTPAAPERPAALATTEARGFALYVGLDEVKAATDGVSLSTLVNALKQVLTDLAPSAQTHAAVALSPRDAGGNDLNIVRRALRDPGLVRTQIAEPETSVIIDLTRKTVDIDGINVNLTFKEFELLEYLLSHEGETVHRVELLNTIWDESDTDRPNERTIDVHVRRLRSKLGEYSQIVRTVRGIGYRFDEHADVTVKRS